MTGAAHNRPMTDATRKTGKLIATTLPGQPLSAAMVVMWNISAVMWNGNTAIAGRTNSTYRDRNIMPSAAMIF